MAITYINGDISTSDNVSTVTGVSWTGLGHAAGDIAFSIWALLTTATTVAQDSDLTTIEDHTDQNLRSFLSKRTMTGIESGTVAYTVDGASLNRMSVSLVIYRGVDSIGTAVRFTEGGTAVEKHPAANNLSITPTADNALILLVYSERSSTGNTAGTLTPPTHVGTGNPATIRKERGTGNSGGTYTCLAEFQLGAGTSGVAQTFTQWDATPDTLVASNADMWLVPLYPPAGTDATPAPAATSVVVAAPAATPSVDDAVAPDTTAVVVAAPQAVPSVSDVGAPAAATTVISAPQATPTVADAATPGVLTGSVSLPQASAVTSGNATAAPSMFAAVAALPAAARSAAGSVTPATLAAVVALQQALPLAASATHPTTLSVVAALPAASPSGSTSRAPAAVAAVVTAPQAARSGTASVSPGLLQVLLSLPPASGPAAVYSPLLNPALSLRGNAGGLGTRRNNASATVRPNDAEAT